MAAIVFIKSYRARDFIFTFSAASGKESGSCDCTEDLN